MHSGMWIPGVNGLVKPLDILYPRDKARGCQAIRWHASKVVGSTPVREQEIIHYFSEFSRRWWRS